LSVWRGSHPFTEKSLSSWPAPHARYCPLESNATVLTGSFPSSRILMFFNLRRSHSRTVPSAEAEAMWYPFSEKDTDVTSCVWPSNVATLLWLFKSHIRTSFSCVPVPRINPSGCRHKHPKPFSTDLSVTFSSVFPVSTLWKHQLLSYEQVAK
jgi:hypothetical protein